MVRSPIQINHFVTSETYICPTYKESFQVRWNNSIPLFVHAAIYLEVSLEQHCTQYHLYTAVSRENAF